MSSTAHETAAFQDLIDEIAEVHHQVKSGLSMVRQADRLDNLGKMAVRVFLVLSSFFNRFLSIASFGTSSFPSVQFETSRQYLPHPYYVSHI